ARLVGGMHPREPGDPGEALGVEPVDDGADPLRGALDPLGDGAVAQAAPREQDNAGVAGVDGVAPLALQAAEFLVFVGAQGSYLNLVHGHVSTSGDGGTSRRGDDFMRRRAPLW